ncbi:head-tail joining protein [Rosenbergiella australiborealis]|uniref:head-tail joining protein n=1 Tax=Rosenbergiella australiborealis TaxID=1544696 RepID=UPI001F4E8882|nr:head-tail joining protein [Rosenbergiella australiborealis]
MSRYAQRLKRVDSTVDRIFAETKCVMLMISGECRTITAILEKPDGLNQISGGGNIEHVSPALSVHTADITGLMKRDAVTIGTDRYWVTHIGADEMGRTRLTLATGAPSQPVADITKWSP